MNNSKNLHGSVHLVGGSSLNASLSLKTNLSAQHMLSSAYFARCAFKIEMDNEGRDIGEFYEEIAANVMASIFSSVAAVEAYANELFIAFYEKSSNIELLKQEYLNLKKGEVIGKYTSLLQLKGKSELETGNSICNDLRGLIRLRNALIHFKAEWDDREYTHKDNHQELEKLLSGKFKPSSFISEGNAFFPKRCMSHSCAEWSIATALRFIEYYCHKAEQNNIFNSYSTRLQTS